MLKTNADEGLKRVIGVRGLAATIVNFSIGVGFNAVPAIICIQLGAAGIIGYVLCALMFAAIILCYVEIGSRVKTTGGSYAYVEAAFGPFAGFIINWLFFFGWGILGDAAVINLVADSLSVVFPPLANAVERALLFSFLLGGMVLINIFNTKKSIRFITVITVIKLVPLLGIVVFGMGYMQAANLRIDHLPSLRSFGETALILFFACAGFESSLSVSGEIKDPNRTIPRGLLWGVGIVFLLYMLIQTTVQGVLGSHAIEFKDAPLAAVAEKIMGTAGIVILLFATAVSGLGSINGDILASPRLLFAGAKDGLFPAILGNVHPRYGTPYWAIITYTTLIFIFSLSGGFKQLAVLASGALLIIYLAVVLAMVKFRLKRSETPGKTFMVKGGLIIPFVAIASILYVLSNLSRQEVLSLVIFIAIISILHFIIRKRKNRPAENAIKSAGDALNTIKAVV